MKNKGLLIIPLILIIYAIIFFILYPSYLKDSAKIILFFAIIFSLIFIISISFMFLGTIMVKGLSDFSAFLRYKMIDFSNYSKKKLSIDKIDYYREIPNNINVSFWIIYNYRFCKNSKLIYNITNSLLLKWLKDGNIELIINETGNTNIKFVNDNIKNKSQKELYKILLKAADENEILESNELKRFCYKNFDTITMWLENYNEEITTFLKDNGYLELTKTKNKRYKITEKLFIEAKKLQGFKKFLLHFSDMQDKDIEHIKLWDDYLIYAQLLGIADKLGEQFKFFNKELENYTNVLWNFSRLISDEFDKYTK